MSATKLLKVLVQKAKRTPNKKPTPTPKEKPTFQSEVRALKGKAMTDAARKAEAKRIAKKYNKSVDAVLRPKAMKKAVLTALQNRAKKKNKPR